MAKKKVNGLTVVQLLENGISEGNWRHIGEAYTGLTGLEPPKVPKGTVMKSQNPEDFLDDIAETEEPEITVQVGETKVVAKGSTKTKLREKFDIDRFQIENGEGTTEDGKKYTKALPFKPGMVNHFETDPVKDLERDDTKYLAKARPHEQVRESVDTKTYNLNCEKCKRSDTVDAWEHHRCTTGDFVHICQSCIREAVRR